VNRNTTKNWKKRGRRKRSHSTGNPNQTYPMLDRFGKGRVKRRNKRIARRINRKKRLPDG
jgi:hypothetical protein